MTYKKLIIAALALVAMPAAGVHAGGLIEFGIKGGIDVDNVDLFRGNLAGTHLFTDPGTGYHFGMMARVNLFSMHLQPEVVYSWNRFEMTSEDNGAKSKSKVRYQSLEVPVMVGWKLLFARVQAGPVFNLMNQTSVGHGSEIDKVDVVRPSMGFALGAGVDVSKLSFDVRYNGQFKRARQHIMIGNDSGDFKSSFTHWSFSVGYRF